MWIRHTVRNVGPPHLEFPLRATEILSTMGVDIPVNYSFQSYQNPVNSGSWYSRWL